MQQPGETPDGLWLRRWLLALNAGLVAAGVWLGATTTPRGYFLAALVPIAIAPFSYGRLRLFRSLAQHVDGGPRARFALRAFAVVGLAFDVVLVAQLVTGRAPEQIGPLQAAGVVWVGPVWFSAHALYFLGCVVAGAARMFRRVGGRALAALRPRPAPASGDAAIVDAPALPERREFLQRAALVGVGMPFAVSLSGVPLSYDFRVEEREIELPGWPRALDGLRVAHLSDIHVGGGMNRERLTHMAELVNGARPDVVMHTGDFLTHRPGNFDEPLYEALARVTAPFGQWGCLGNHDFDDASRLVRRLRDAGVRVLRQHVVPLQIAGQPLEIAGLDFLFDPLARDETYTRLVDGLGPRTGAPRILLNHDPRAFRQIPTRTADLVLSGHTHGGHIGVQLGPSHAVTVVGLLGIPDQGVYERDDMRLFVTRCVGFYGYPMRVGIPPEIAILVLRAPRGTTTA